MTTVNIARIILLLSFVLCFLLGLWLLGVAAIPFVDEQALERLFPDPQTAKMWGGFGEMISSLLGLASRAKLKEEFYPGRQLNGVWYWVAYVRDAQQKLTNLGLGSSTITGLDNYKKRQDSPNRVIIGKVTEVFGIGKVSHGQFTASDILIGRKSASRLTYEWAYDDDRYGRRSGITILTIQYSAPRRSWKCIYLCKAEKVNYMQGTFFSDQDAGKGKVFYFRDQEEAEKRYLELSQEIQR